MPQLKNQKHNKMKCCILNITRKCLLPLFFNTIFSATAQIPEGYYNSAKDLSGEHLKNALHEIIKGHTEFPYTASGTDVWDILKVTDKDTLNPDNVILLYSGRSVNAAQEYNDGNGWTREQVWALSHGDFGTGKGAGTDVHHVRPVDHSVNSARNNKDFDWGGTLYIDGDGPTGCYSDADSWEPRDAVKGDVARMLFYMAVRYAGENGEPDLELVDVTNSNELTEPGKGFHGKLSALLEWHKTDPVDSFEMRRNEVIFSYQKNRNPFIDHPGYAEQIWTVTGIDELVEKQIKIYPNPARDFICIEWLSVQPAQGFLLSADGAVVMSFPVSGTTRLTIPKKAPGVYIMRIEAKDDIYTNKLIIGN
jgi:endonuclease I